MNKFKYKPGDVVYFNSEQVPIYGFLDTVQAGDINFKTQEVIYTLSSGVRVKESELYKNLEDLPNYPKEAKSAPKIRRFYHSKGGFKDGTKYLEYNPETKKVTIVRIDNQRIPSSLHTIDYLEFWVKEGYYHEKSPVRKFYCVVGGGFDDGTEYIEYNTDTKKIYAVKKDGTKTDIVNSLGWLELNVKQKNYVERE
jgi:hypothetical protein